MKNKYTGLLIEDQSDDAELIELQLAKSDLDINIKRVQSISKLKESLEKNGVDLIISDYNLNDFTGEDTLEIVKSYSPDLPFILVSGYLGEEKAVEMMVAGANDVVKKDALERLTPVVERELLNYKKRQKQQEVLENAYSLAEIGHWEVDLETNTVNWSKEVKQIHEVDNDYSPTLDQAIKFFQKGHYRDHVTELINRAIQIGENYKLDALITTAKGNKRWIRSVGKPKIINGKCVYLYGSVQNITRQKEISEKQEMLSKVASETHDSVIITDLDHHIVWVNHAFEIMTGYTLEEVKGKNPSLLQGPDSDPQTVAFMSEKLKNNEEFTAEILNYTKTGNPYWIEIKVSPIIDDDGNISQFFSIQTDITERRKNISRLKERQRRLEEAQRLGKIGDWNFNIQTGEIYWSGQMYEIYGRDPEKGPPDYDQLVKYYPKIEDAKLHDQKVKQAIKTGGSYALDLKSLTEKGEEKYVHAEGFANMNGIGEVVGLYGIVQDITDRKQNELETLRREEQLRAVTNNIDAAVYRYVLKPDGSDELLYVSDSIEKIHEVTAKQAMESVSVIWNQILEEDVQRVIDSVQYSANTMKTWNHRFRVRTPSGKFKWILGRGNPTKRQDGSTLWDTVVMDVSDQVHKEQLNETLIQEVHHRVKNNLAIIIGFLDLQLHELPDDSRERLILERAINRIHSIAQVHKLLYEGEGFSNVNVRDYLESLQTHITSTMNLKTAVSFEIEAADIQMNVNELTPLGMLINELITNSVKYAFSDQKNGRITIRVFKDENIYRVLYQDNGQGVEEDTFKNAHTSGFNIVKILLAQLEADYQLIGKDGFSLAFTFKNKVKGAHGNIGL
jgi:PAS domain S-box-containing protein